LCNNCTGGIALLRIRNEQMSAFESARMADFENRLFKASRGSVHWLGEPMPEEKVRAQLALCLSSGRRFFSTERDLAKYVEITMAYLGGCTGADHPRAALEMLVAPALRPERRLDNFERWARSRQPNAG
jgi:hypothetical protein